jgi:N-acetylmuramic acid 6-phosphate etherase
VAGATKRLPPTEQRNPRTKGIDLRTTREILRAINREDRTVAFAVGREIGAISRAVDKMVQSLSTGGRVFYIGAGTSGRLATLDAAEIPPTFGVSAGRIQAIVAGGKRALTHAVEGAEDSSAQGARDIATKRISKRDVAIGIAASGKTPYVLGALKKARQAGAATIGITSHRNSPLARAVHVLIAPDTGPEVITGSTRMKAGTAQKLVLNMLSTATMIRLGRVYDNWMSGVALTNRKLQARGLRILQEASGADVPAAARAMRQSGHEMPIALIMLNMGADAKEARRRLQAASGNLRDALREAAKKRGEKR